MTRRSYAKGLAKREEILGNALAVIAEHGFGGTTLRELADASNLSITGLVHHFGTKEQLLTEVLRRRDELTAEDYGTATLPETAELLIERLNERVEHNAAAPGLIALYSNLAADAVDPAHPAHEYFRERFERSRDLGRQSIAHLQELGELPGEVDAADLAQLIIAAMDGLQLLSQFDSEVSMARSLQALETLMRMASAPATP